MILSVLFTAPGYEDIERLAIKSCPLNKRPTEKQRELVKALFKIEREEGVPEFARGILAAAACREAAYKLRVGCGDGGASCGLFQFSRTKKRFRKLREMGAQGEDPRLDIEVAARYWLRSLKGQLWRARRDCRKKRHGYPSYDEYIWASANKTATWRYKCKRSGKCRAWNPDGSCKKKYCASQAARCSIPPWKWKGRGKYRRQETRHWMLIREWHREAKAVHEARLASPGKDK